MRLSTIGLIRAAILSLAVLTPTAYSQATNAVRDTGRPWEYGPIIQGGVGLTEERNDFGFFMAGGHLGKVITPNAGPKGLHGNFELATELFPFWQSYTPTFQRVKCTGTSVQLSCSAPYTVGGTFTGITFTPAIFRWNFTGTNRISYWAQAAGGLLWTNHKYPAYGPFATPTLANSGPNSDTSVWNFTPQGGVGLHYFLHPNRSIDFGANAIHISSASLGDRNPGVNASVQFSLGYTWWK
jgi:hypothetical protein